MKILFYIILFFSSAASATVLTDVDQVLFKARSESWSQERQWRLLLHYRPKTWGREKSQTDSPSFFLHPEGAKRADLELEALIKEFFHGQIQITSVEGAFTEPARCVFPARFMWLARKLKRPLDLSACERYQRFQSILSAQSATYVFSSYYLNNPASGFGHTFLRLNKAPSARTGERYQLSDYGVGYAAVMISQNPLVYSILGLSGMMPGSFDINPYYYKVREYNDFESRDIWEYDLTLTPDEVEFLVAHIWELIPVGFDYHYLTENCSYRILAILETTRPSLNLISKLKTQVMPADTVEIVFNEPGLVKNLHYRPSNRVVFSTRYESLSSSLKERIHDFAGDEKLEPLVQQLSTDEKRQVLDVAIDYLDYRYAGEILRREGPYQFKQEVLRARAEVGGVTPELQVLTPLTEAPHVAHGSRRLGLGHRFYDEQDISLLAMKLSLHDLLDPLTGYPPTAQITMGEGVLSFNHSTQEVAVDRITLFEVVSLSPWTDFNHSPSWRLKISSERQADPDCSVLCRQNELTGGIGHTRTVAGAEVSAWLRTGVIHSNEFNDQTTSLIYGPSLQLRYHFHQFSLLGEIYYRYASSLETHERRLLQTGVQWSP
ncbi:MAG: DUF4105 domain-containing protein, partial [Bdellovibrio sp.]